MSGARTRKQGEAPMGLAPPTAPPRRFTSRSGGKTRPTGNRAARLPAQLVNKEAPGTAHQTSATIVACYCAAPDAHNTALRRVDCGEGVQSLFPLEWSGRHKWRPRVSIPCFPSVVDEVDVWICGRGCPIPVTPREKRKWTTRGRGCPVPVTPRGGTSGHGNRDEHSLSSFL